jgi:hypothetical protein
MKTLLSLALLGCFALTSLASVAVAKDKTDKWLPPGLSTDEQAEWKNGRPPGWSQGQKKGWQGKPCPPGQAKKGRCGPGTAGAAGMTSNTPQMSTLEAAIQRIIDWARGRKTPQATLDAMLFGLQGAVHYGVPIPVAEKFVVSAAERGVAPAGIEVLTRALAYGAQRGVAPDRLEYFAESGLSRGIAADALALGLYRLGADAKK